MKKASRIIIFLFLSVFDYISLFLYLFYKKNTVYDSFEIFISRLLSLTILNILFITLIFLIEIKYYKQIFTLILIIMSILWTLVYITELLIVSRSFWDLWEILMFFISSMITPGLIVYIIYYIKKSTVKFENAKILGKYHIHEGFVGIIFLSIGILFYILRLNLLFLKDPLWKRYSFILLLAQILTFAFLYLGNFFFFRDLHDVLKLKFINLIKEPAEVDSTNQSSSFDNITQNNLHFFKIPKLLLYPMGIMLTILSINMVIYGSELLPVSIFKLNNEYIINLGYIFCYIAAGLIGLDWLRIYKKFYPDQYRRIRDKINSLENESA